ncbi:MAG: ABC transporter permease [Gemmataceae bacterium]|nr:ABC transporter permease [Gemmataceae bacterium]MDW8241653.1 ABC transporter permease [Thermogemmata sp.]
MQGGWNILGALLLKDWQLLWAERRAVLFSFVVPIVLASAFAMLFDRPAAQQDQGVRLPLWLVVEDSGPITEELVRHLLASPRLEVRQTDRAHAEAAVRQQRIGVALIIPEGFGQAAAQGARLWMQPSEQHRPQLIVLHGATAVTEKEWAAGVITEIVMKQLCLHHFGQWMPKDQGNWQPPLQMIFQRLAPSPQAHFNVYTHSFCGMTLQYLLFWGMECGLMLLRERQGGAWRRLRALATPWKWIVVAKALITASMGSLQVLATFTFGWLVFGVTVEGSWLGFALLALTVCLLAAATGLLVAAWGEGETQARNLSILVILAASMLGGLWLPAFLLPQWVRDLTLVLPTAWAMNGLSAATWQGGSFVAVLPAIGVVFAFALLLLVLAVVRLHYLERRAL